MAWIAQVPPSPRHPKPRWQVRYQDGKGQRSAGIYHTPKAAEAVRRRIERGLSPPFEDVTAAPVDDTKAQTLFGDYLTKVWWPTWKTQHPDSAYQTGKRIEKRVLPFFGNLSFSALDADQVGAWKASLGAAGLKPATVNSYLSLLGTILNAAVDSEYLSHSPLMRKSRAGPGRRGQEPAGCPPRGLGHPQPGRCPHGGDRAPLPGAGSGGGTDGDALGRAGGAALGRPPSEPAPERRCGRGPGPATGRTRVQRPPPQRQRPRQGSRSEARRRTIALDEETCDTFRAHREQFGDKDRGLVFTTPGGPRGRGGALAANNFRRVWLRALQQAGLDGGWPEYGGLHFHDLRHSHATWLLALRVPMIEVSARLGMPTRSSR